jgi:lipid-A-disaccharide synthase-like uncharacterized protein
MMGDFDLSNLRLTLTEGSRIEAAWLFLGLAAQLIFLLCLIGQWFATRKRGRMFLPASMIYLGLLATLILLIYASVRHDIVFVVGQLMNMLIGFRLLEMAGSVNDVSRHRDETPFPEIRPDSAQRKPRNQ